MAPPDFPSKPIRVLIPASAGATGDILSRILAGPMGKALGQTIVVEPMPGAGGITATERLVRSARDGHTIAMTSNNHVINPGVYKSMPFDSIRDIAPISVVGSTPVAIVAHPSLGARTAQELIALARARPGQLNYGSGGNGSVLHLAGVLFTSEAGVDIRHVPYKGFAPMLTDVLGGQIQLGIGGVAPVAEYVKAGRLRAIGVTTRTRSTILPDVPTFAESGLPNYSFEGWLALIGPAGPAQAGAGQAARGRHDGARAEGSAGGVRGAGCLDRRQHAGGGSRLLPLGTGQAHGTGQALRRDR